MARREVIDSVGQQSPRSIPCDYDDVYASRVEIIDKVGQQSPQSTLLGVNNMNMVHSEVIDNFGQRSPWSLQSKVDEIRVFGASLLIMLVNDPPVLKLILGSLRLEWGVILLTFLNQ